jgi:acetylornithine/succinyldiaminopimelate/putrescine aminotransferase/predicted amino acid dehydrogenase
MSLFEELARRAVAEDSRSGSDIPAPESDAYGEYCRPALYRRLAAIGVDRPFVWSEGDFMAYEEDGARHEVLDMVGGAGSTLFGHNNPELVAYARSLLAERIPQHAQSSNRAYAGMLARRISERLEAATGRRFVGAFSSTGTEAVEAAIAHGQMEKSEASAQLLSSLDKAFALALHTHRDELRLSDEAPSLVTELLGSRPEGDLRILYSRIREYNARVMRSEPLLLAIGGSFHGTTTGSLSLTFNEEMREPFAAPRLRSCWIPPGDCETASRLVEQEILSIYTIEVSKSGQLRFLRQPWCNVLALFVEAVQGEGGVHPLDSAFLAHLRKLGDEHGFPMVIDEIQSGMGRCGEFTASERLGLRGDYYVFAKALGGGIAKVAVTMIDRDRYQEKFGWIRGSTFAEDEYGCLLGMRALEILDRDGLASQCEKKGRYLREKLLALQRRYPEVVRDVRGMGLMVGLELAEQASSPSRVLRLVSNVKGLGAIASGYLFKVERIRVMSTSSSPNTLRLEPSAYIDVRDIDRTVAALDRLCQLIEHADAGRLVGHLVGPARITPAPECSDDWRQRQTFFDQDPRPAEPRVAFLAYPVESWRLRDWDPSLSVLSSETLDDLLRAWSRIVPGQVSQKMRIESPTGKSVHLTYITLLFSSQMIEEEMESGRSEELLARVDEAVDLAHNEGCRVIGFGGLTSVVTHNCRKAARTDIALTTGNALTVGMGMEAIRTSAPTYGVDLTRSRAAVVGAAGNIASVYARLLARSVPELALVGRRHSLERLRALAARIYLDACEDIRAGHDLQGVAATLASSRTIRKLAEEPAGMVAERGGILDLVTSELGPRAPIQIAEDLHVLERCRVIVSASNSTSPIIFARHLSPGPLLICDIAVPSDVAPEVIASRPDVVVLVGGAVRVPGNERLKIFASTLPEGFMYACVAETALLGLMERYEHFSFGEIEPSQVEWIMDAAKAHGFECGFVRVS